MGELRLLPCDPSDAAEILAEQFAAFSSPNEPCFFILFPETEERDRAVKRMLDWWVGDESATYVKAVDVDTGGFTYNNCLVCHERSGHWSITKELTCSRCNCQCCEMVHL